MENVMNYGFVELSNDEMTDVDGGAWWAAVGAGLTKVGTVVGTACGVGATGGLIIVGAAVVAVGVGVYIGVTK